jgi:hypothetical protein
VGNDEEALPSMAGSNVGCCNNCPFRIEPDFGKVSEHIGKSKSEVSSDVLQDCVSRSQRANGIPYIRPEVSLIVFTFPFTC